MSAKINQAPAFAGPDDSPGYLLWQASNLWQRNANRILIQYQLTHVQFVLLAGVAFLDSQNVEITQANLAEHSKIDAMTVSKCVKLLVDKGLIDRRLNPRDNRANLVSLTASGRAMLNNATPAVINLDEQFFAPLMKQDLLKNFFESLQNLTAAHRDGDSNPN